MARGGSPEVAGRTRRGPAGGPKFQPSFSHRRRNSHPKSGTETSARGDPGRFGRGRCVPRPCRDVEGAGGTAHAAREVAWSPAGALGRPLQPSRRKPRETGDEEAEPDFILEGNHGSRGDPSSPDG